MSDSNKKQAMMPKGATPLRNEVGTAPGVFIENSGKSIFLMPGVPMEMRSVFRGSVLPRILSSYQPSRVEIQTLNVTGISESMLYDRIKDIPGADEAIRYYPGPDGIVMKIISDRNFPIDTLSLRNKVCDELGGLVYSTNGESMEQVVGKMLFDEGLTVAIAESCTGGLLADRLTNIPGSSDYLLCSVVAYSNNSKQAILGVDSKLIEKYGAVSAEVAAAMSEGVRKISGADIGISTTGIAGPGGGSEKKPVGLLYSAISSTKGTETKKLQFVEERLINKRRMTQASLDILRNYLKRETQKQ